MTLANPGETLLVHTRAELEAARAGRVGDVAVVMTMGALHEGHLALIRAARRRAKTVVVTVFVNPLQFGPSEDFARYPRTIDADLKLCEQAEVDIVFAPAVEDVYPGGEPMVRITPGPMGDVLEGAHRPGHFSGMLTVVNKLINLTEPDYAFFGEKDAQQLALIRRMALDLNLPVEIVPVPTVREPDGLARASRNRYLGPQARVSAVNLSRALFAGAEQRTPGAIRAAARAVLDRAARAEPPVELDYLALFDPATFAEIDEAYRGPAVLALAANVGGTRLIDNLPLGIEG
ncbi:pantoate--beta-alanine ligase [Actinospica sp.]|jgi:pantoate--beta-alanine ligase|uniref:pantoate--beta-alanine ligase n=1 Tax=Actinospica sp. TaxID=1872142 RepID=UPI002B62A97F|nr:pantoate--beta-alanine ligase [Actinospica sp.]HWG23724.1 pantoate--beta-alanine ligase [Actinospica sp.]